MSRLEKSRGSTTSIRNPAMGYAAVGDVDRAFDCLERAFQVRSAGLIYLHVEPRTSRCAPIPVSVSWWSGSDCGNPAWPPQRPATWNREVEGPEPGRRRRPGEHGERTPSTLVGAIASA